jgi:hypothetical protein
MTGFPEGMARGKRTGRQHNLTVSGLQATKQSVALRRESEGIRNHLDMELIQILAQEQAAGGKGGFSRKVPGVILRGNLCHGLMAKGC